MRVLDAMDPPCSVMTLPPQSTARVASQPEPVNRVIRDWPDKAPGSQRDAYTMAVRNIGSQTPGAGDILEVASERDGRSLATATWREESPGSTGQGAG